MRRLAKKVAATAMALTMTAAMATTCFAANWGSYFGANADWYEGAEGKLTANTAAGFTASINSVGWGGVWGAQVYIDGKPLENPEEMQLNYLVQTTGPYITEDMFRELGISKDDQTLISNEGLLMEMGLTHRDAQGRLAPAYDLPLTKKMYETRQQHRYGTGNILRPNVSVEPLYQMGPQQLRPDLDTEKRCHHQAD